MGALTFLIRKHKLQEDNPIIFPMSKTYGCRTKERNNNVLLKLT